MENGGRPKGKRIHILVDIPPQLRIETPLGEHLETVMVLGHRGRW